MSATGQAASFLRRYWLALIAGVIGGALIILVSAAGGSTAAIMVVGAVVGVLIGGVITLTGRRQRPGEGRRARR